MRIFFCLLFLASASPALSAEWQIDKEKSLLTFSATQIGDVIVNGRVLDFNARLCFDEMDLDGTIFMLSFPIKNLTTDVEERDEILVSEEWLNAEKFPGAGFQLTDFSRVSPNSYEATGVLELKGTRKEITFPLTLSLLEERAAGSLTIDRRDFNIGDGAWGETEKWVKFPIMISFDIYAVPVGETCEH